MNAVYTTFGVEGNTGSCFDQSIVKGEPQPQLQKWTKLYFSFVEIISSNGIYEIKPSDIQASEAYLDAASITEIQTFIESKLGFNPTQMAKMLGITRQSYYNHRKNLPISDSIVDSYNAAYEMVLEINERFPLAFKGMKSVLVGGKSLASWLSNSNWNSKDIFAAAQSVHEKMLKMPDLVKVRLSVEDQDNRANSITRRG